MSDNMFRVKKAKPKSFLQGEDGEERSEELLASLNKTTFFKGNWTYNFKLCTVVHAPKK
jgi:hypothetical protein